MKTRKNRYEFRETLKYKSNKKGQIKAQHPQVRIQLEDMRCEVRGVIKKYRWEIDDETGKIIKVIDDFELEGISLML